MRKVSAFNIIALTLGIAFLYLPIAVLVVYSFNASRLVAVWGGWSTRWYAALVDDAPLIDSALISIRLALVAASAATLLGTLAALALTRLGRFHGRLLFAGMIYAPLVMPEVITGLSLLLLFVAVAAGRLPSPTPPWRCASSPSSCSRALSISTEASKRRRWISAPRRSRRSVP